MTETKTTSRSDGFKWLIGDCTPDIVGEENGTLVYSHYNKQLPTNRQILKQYCFLRMDKDNKITPLTDLLDIVLKDVFEIWDKAKIPIQTKFWCKSKISELLSNWENLKKLKNRNTVKEEDKRKLFVENLDRLFDIVQPDWEAQVSKVRLRSKEAIAEDLKFIVDQRGERKMFLAELDLNYQRVTAHKKQRMEDYEKRKEKEGRRENAEMLLEDFNVEDYVDVEMDENLGDSDFQGDLESSKKKDKVLLSLPRKIFEVSDLCEMADRFRLSNGAVVGMVSSVIKAGGGNLKDFYLSISTARRHREKVRKEEYEAFYRDFIPPKHGVLAWDGKLVRSENIAGSDKNIDYLGIVMSGNPHMTEGKVIEVEEISSSTGKDQAEAVLKAVEDGGAKNFVHALLFDTTASNTGVKKGAAILIMKELGRPLLFLECRHHVSELLLKQAWYSLFEDCSGPDNSDFGAFANVWKYLHKDQVQTLYILPGIEQSLKEEVVPLLISFLSNPNRQER